MVVVDGERYAVNTDFRCGIAYNLLLSGNAEVGTVFGLCFVGEAPANIDGAIEALNAFYACCEQNEGGEAQKAAPPYSFSADTDAIYGLFLERYQIDLLTAKLHWWQFRALLNNALGDNLEQRIQYRCADLAEIKNSKQRAHFAKMRRKYALQMDGRKQIQPQTLEEYNAWLLTGGRAKE